MSHLPIQLDSLLHARTVESTRIEFKATWDEYIKESAVQTICAFANDLYNQNGGYVVVGVKSDNEGRAILPPRGLAGLNVDQLQLEIIGACKRIEPAYLPQVFVEAYQGKTILIVWAPPGFSPPYNAPRDAKKGGKARYIRSGSMTIEAAGELERLLIQKSERVPYDDQPNFKARLGQISPVLVRQYLENVKSGLLDDEISDEEIYEKMNLLWPVNGHSVPRNVALLFFNFNPETFFRGAIVELARYSFEGDVLDEQIIKGPLDHQVRLTVNSVRSLIRTLSKKIDGQIEVQVSKEYPIEAVEEALANALYHRSYESDQVEPVKVLIHPDRMQIVSYPGPVPGLSLEHLVAGNNLNPPPARNRRIGDFFKELRMAERRGSGLSKIRRAMARNGSPEPQFTFDEARSSFATVLPVHPSYRVANKLDPVLQAWNGGDRQRALDGLREELAADAGNTAMARQAVEYLFELELLDEAASILDKYVGAAGEKADTLLLLEFASGMTRRGRMAEAAKAIGLLGTGAKRSGETEG